MRAAPFVKHILSFTAALFLAVRTLVAANANGITNLWTLRVGDNNSGSSPALSPDGTLYFGAWDHNLYAVGTNRFIKWSFPTGLEIKSSPAVADDGTIYVGSRDRKLYAVTPGGKLKWSFVTDGWVDSSPGIATNGTIYFGSWDKKFYALNPDGSTQWIFATTGEIVSSPAIGADGTIYFGSHDKKLYALRSDGTKKWEFATGGPIISSPAIDFSGKIYFSSVDGKFYALNPDGTQHWNVRTGGISESSPVISNDGTIFIGINDNRAAISADGKVKWKQPDPDQQIDTTAAIVADGHAYFAVEDTSFSALDESNSGMWWYYAGTPFVASPVIGPDRIAYVPGTDGRLFAFEVSAPLMDSPWPMFRANPRRTGVVNKPRK